MTDGTRTTLTFNTDDVVKALQAEQQTRQDKRDAAKAAADAENAKKVDQLVELLTDVPEFLVWVCDQINYGWSDGSRNVGTDAFFERIKNNYKKQSDGGTADPDADLKRLIRVYELATDKTVSLTPTDEPYRYL